MGIDAILQRIRDEGKRQCEAISGEANAQAAALLEEGRRAAAERFQRLMAEALRRSEQQRHRSLTDVRLECRRDLLVAKQKAIDRLFSLFESTLEKGRFKKQQVSHTRVQETVEEAEFYLAKLRRENETEIAKILFS